MAILKRSAPRELDDSYGTTERLDGAGIALDRVDVRRD
jgi:hypothetical protein